MNSLRLRLVVCGAALLALSSTALADHGKAGLWNITSKMTMANMPQIPPDKLAKMQAMGIQMPTGNSVTTQHCMTAAEVKMDRPPLTGHAKDCTLQNLSISGAAVKADMVCSTGDMQGNGHLSVSYDSDTHYAGQMTFVGTAHGHPADMTNSFEGTWLSADCGSVAH
ncbi:MAG: DUF3617 domain-containing protein [Rhizomicrobium sp.]|jgi:hypothetical protein